MKVDCVIPAYNQGKYLAAAIDSVLAQDHPVRPVVVNDGSTDETAEVCAGYAGSICYLPQANAGVSAARNMGLQHATGEGVVFLDADDLLEPGWVRKAVAACERAREAGRRVGIFYGDCVLFDDSNLYEQTVSIKRVSVDRLLRDSLLIPSGTFVTRACLDEVGVFDSTLDTCEDWDYWLRAALANYEFERVDAIGLRHREHGAGASKREVSALHVRIRFLEHWLKSEQLDAARHGIVKQELYRTYLRLRRATSDDPESSRTYLAEAFQVNPDAAMDPWLFVYGAVYAAPFFRTRAGGEARNSIEDMHQDVSRLLSAAGRLDARARRRLKAGTSVARAADAALARRRIGAGSALLRAIGADPSLLLDVLKRRKNYVDEFTRGS